MPSLRIAILARHSLLADALARQLALAAGPLEVRAYDASAPSVLGHLLEWRPDLVMVDANDDAAARRLPILLLLQALPDVKVIQFHPNDDEVRVFSSVRLRVERLSDLLRLAQNLPSAAPALQP